MALLIRRLLEYGPGLPLSRRGFNFFAQKLSRHNGDRKRCERQVCCVCGFAPRLAGAENR